MITFNKARLVSPFDLKVALDAETVFRAKPELEEFRKRIPTREPRQFKA